jgi:putative ABC transport system permease protein
MRMNIPTETIITALGMIRAHKFRSFLTVLGITVGITTVITIASILTGLRGRIVSIVEEFGTNNIYAFHLSSDPPLGERDRRELLRKPLREEDGKAILAQTSAVYSVAEVLSLRQLGRTVESQGLAYKYGDLQGVSANFAEVANVSLQEGRFISESDDLHRREVMVIGVNIVESLFPNQARVTGRQVKFQGRPFEIIGVLERRRSILFGENAEDNAIFIPLRTGRKLSPYNEGIRLHIRARSGMLVQAINQVEEVLRRQRGVKSDEPNDFELSTAIKIIEQFDSVTMYVGLITIAISAIGLLVGGIGVMNIMLVCVTERTHEIGIRKAVGARRRDIVQQFLFEAITLTFLGGLLGVILAVVISYLIMLFIPDLPASIPLWAILCGLMVSVAVGLIFGVLPAKKAAGLDPIECLRYE